MVRLIIVVILVGVVLVGLNNMLLSSTAHAATDKKKKPTPTAVPLPEMAPWWQPIPGTTWQIQFTGKLKTKYKVDMYDIDLFDHESSVVDTLHYKGIVVVAYINAGAWENWRPDAGLYPEEVMGNNNGWKGERWLDIRQIDVIGPIIEARLDLAVEKGFDGVDFDNVDGYTNETGFPLTYQDQLYFNTWLANAAHMRGLSVGLKNDIEQVKDLEPYFDWAVNEQCFQYNECDYPDGGYLHFIDAGKPVFQIEYKLKPKKYCSQAIDWGFSSIRKKTKLNAWMKPCK